MDELITRHLRGETTDIEARRIERWRTESPDNEAAYRSFIALWQMGETSLPSSPPPPAGVIVAEAERRRRRARWRPALASPWTGYALAAAALVALILLRPWGSDTAQLPSLVPTGSTASAGDVVTMSLSDGSVVRLASATTIEFPPSSDQRLVRLSGKAFFAIAPGEEPFVVRTSGGDITVHGTRFEVSTEGDDLRLVVVEGTVALHGEGGTAAVRAGQVAHLRGSAAPAVVDMDDVWSLLDWVGGLLVFQDTPLDEAGVEIGRHFGVRVTVGEGVRSRRITAWFSDESIDEVLSAVCLVAGTSCTVGEDRISIGADGARER